jgi:LuxR family transcriptional regulator, maltose regulon positive regulatory protein
MKAAELFQGEKKVIPHNLLFRNKVSIPIIQQNPVSRMRIDNDLSIGLKGSLTLVIAPAGFGKTTAVADWIGRAGLPAAWFSADSEDNTIKRFWSYLTAALDGIMPGLEDRLSHYMYDISSITAESIVTILVDEFFNYKKNFLLVIDDYHLLTDDSIHKSLEIFIRYKPQNAHVIIISRSKPPFAAARLKAEGQLKEIRLAELQFSGLEIEQYCRQKGLAPSRNDSKRLEAYTEGWAAGLYLTLESTGNNFNFSRLYSASGRNSRQIASYLTEEVTGRWTEAENAFMIKTSVLPSMSGSLCDAVTGRSDGKEMLERLSSSNAFILPLDNEGSWYRYHHLYAEFLREISDSRGIDKEDLHKRAAEWYELNGYASEAVEHYLKSGKLDNVVGIIEKKGPEMVKTGDLPALSECFRQLPDGIIAGNDMLCLTGAWLLALSGRTTDAEKWIGLMEERYMGGFDVNATEDWVRQMQAEILAYRGVTGLSHESPQVIFQIIMKFRETVKVRSIFCSTGINFSQGDASLLSGIVGMKGHLRMIDREFAGIYESARKSAIRRYLGYIPVLMGEIAFERNHAEMAVPLLIKGMEEAEDSNTACSYVPAIITLARIAKAKGDIVSTGVLLADGEKKLKSMGNSHMVPVLAAFKARLAMEAGENEAVNDWIRRCCLDIYDKPGRQRIYEHITLIRALIFKKEYDSCTLLLTRLHLLAETENNAYYRIELHILHSILLIGQGQTRKAMETLAEALRLGEREGYERIFIEEGITMGMLLSRFLKWNVKQEAPGGLPVPPLYVRKLLKYNREYSMMMRACTRKNGKCQSSPNHILQPLTRREKEVLRLLGSELTNAEIAATLDITVNTVKVNCSSIYRKLNVKNRDQAVACVRESRNPGN